MLSRLTLPGFDVTSFTLMLVAACLSSAFAASGLTYAIVTHYVSPPAPEVCELPADKVGAFLELDAAAL